MGHGASGKECQLALAAHVRHAHGPRDVRVGTEWHSLHHERLDGRCDPRLGLECVPRRILTAVRQAVHIGQAHLDR